MTRLRTARSCTSTIALHRADRDATVLQPRRCFLCLLTPIHPLEHGHPTWEQDFAGCRQRSHYAAGSFAFVNQSLPVERARAKLEKKVGEQLCAAADKRNNPECATITTHRGRQNHKRLNCKTFVDPPTSSNIPHPFHLHHPQLSHLPLSTQNSSSPRHFHFTTPPPPTSFQCSPPSPRNRPLTPPQCA